MSEFEEILEGITKPQVTTLRHEAVLQKALMRIKSESVVSFWWLIIPFYVFAALLVKTYFVPASTFRSVFQEMIDKEGYIADLLFLVVPCVLVLVNAASIRTLHSIVGRSAARYSIKVLAAPLAIIVCSIATIIIYLT